MIKKKKRKKDQNVQVNPKVSSLLFSCSHGCRAAPAKRGGLTTGQRVQHGAVMSSIAGDKHRLRATAR